ncbi:MAG: ribonuclease J [Oscillospiraceae bacterium]|nr:ribonuclease J [Oscillospiraceae bacterium]
MQEVNNKSPRQSNKPKLKIIPLGGMNEIGKNMTVIEYGNDMILVDCGLAFPDEELLGIDLVIPDISYISKNHHKLRGLFVTHGHEDHIGAIPYLLPSLQVPVYCTRLTAGLLEIKLDESGYLKKASINRVEAGTVIQCGSFKVEFINVNHSIADSVSLAIHTPVGVVVVTGDFKIDTTPVEGKMIDLARFGALGKKGVLCLLSDSTNAERPGYTMSESKVGESFDALFKGCEQRIIVTTFASNIHRLQQIINAAHKVGRKVAVTGRSMENIMKLATELGYIKPPNNTLVDINAVKGVPKHKLVIITTGSQGEPMSALYRMAISGHKYVEIGAGDKVIMSSSAIPGNEKMVSRVINELLRKGAEVVYEKLADIHVSGHACQEELKIILGLCNPKFFLPVHGEYRHLRAHANLAKQMGMHPKNIFLGDVGMTLELTESTAKLGATVPAGRVLVDGMSVGDIGGLVLRERKHMSEDGLIIVCVTFDSGSNTVVAGPEIVTRGFMLNKEPTALDDEMHRVAQNALNKAMSGKPNADWASIKTVIKGDLSSFISRKVRRNPLILPVFMEV